jgi:hypothetical protein
MTSRALLSPPLLGAALVAAFATASGCGGRRAPLAPQASPGEDPWFSVSGSAFTDRGARPVYTGSGRGLVLEIPERTGAARAATGPAGMPVLTWAERPSGEDRWRLQIRAWVGGRWQPLSHPLYPDPIPDREADPFAVPAADLLLDPTGRPVLAWQGVSSLGPAPVSAWWLDGVMWSPLGLPLEVEALVGLALTPDEGLFLAAEDQGHTGIWVWGEEDDWEALPEVDAVGLRFAGGAGGPWLIGAPGGTVLAWRWDGERWREVSPPIERAEEVALTEAPGGGVLLATRDGDRARIWRSLGESWEAASGPLALGGRSLAALGYDGSGAPLLVVGTVDEVPPRDIGFERAAIYRAGEGWEQVNQELLLNMPHGDAPALAAAPGGAPGFAWSGAPEGLPSVFFVADDGQRFKGLERARATLGVSRGEQPAQRTAVAVSPGGQPAVAWIEQGPGSSTVKWSALEEGAWTPPALIAGGLEGAVLELDLWYDDGRLTASWRAGSEGPLTAMQLGRRGWQPTEAVRAARWAGTLEGEGRDRALVLRGDGAEAVAPLPMDPAFAEVAVGADEAGAPLVAWTDERTGALEIYLARWSGEGWSELSGSAGGGGVSNSSSPSRYPDVAAGGGLICVSWAESAAGPRQAVLRCHQDVEGDALAPLIASDAP